MKVMYEEASPGEAREGVRKWNGAGRDQTGSAEAGWRVCWSIPTYHEPFGAVKVHRCPLGHRVFRYLFKHYSGGVCESFSKWD